MFRAKDTCVNKLDGLKDNIKVNCYHIKATDLKRMLDMPIKKIDGLLLDMENMPITKYRKIGSTYYVFPMELLIADYILTKTNSVKVKDLTQATK